MTPQRLARSGGLTFAFVVTGAGLAFAATLVVSNASGAAAAGQFFQVVAVLAIATTLSTFGADTGLVRSVPALTARGQASAVPAVLRIAGRPVLVLAAGVAGTAAVLALAPGALPDGVGPAVLLAAPFLVLGAALNLAFGALRGLHRVPTFSFLQNVVLPSLRVLGVLGVVLAGGGLLALTAAWTVPVAVVCVLALVLLHRIVRGLRDEPGAAPPPDAGTQRRAFWSFSSARGVTAVVEALLEWLDVLLVAAFLGPAAAGVYGVVNRCIRVGAMLDHTARIVTGPSISAALAVDDLAAAGGEKETLALLRPDGLAAAADLALAVKDQQREEGLRAARRRLRRGEQIDGKIVTAGKVSAEVRRGNAGGPARHVQRLRDVQGAGLSVGTEAAVVAHAVGHVAALLHLCHHDAAADGVDGARGDEHRVARLDIHAAQDLGKRVVRDAAL